MTDQATTRPTEQSATENPPLPPVSRTASRNVRRAAEALVEAKVQQAVEAFQAGQFKSIRAAAHSRSRGHHSRSQNCRPARIVPEGSTGIISARTARRRRQRARMAMEALQSSLDVTGATRPIPVGAIPAGLIPAKPAAAVPRERRRSLTIPNQAPLDQSSNHLNTEHLLRELSKRFENYESTARSHIDTLRQSLTAEIIVNLSTHFARQAEQIERLQRDVSNLQNALTKEASNPLRHDV
ncbi:hypothetical protein GGS24DRAFT_261302 [Hypoxylon argillaceum]|nr:hypothetical protein GGS24DRAFT_261302 [Hypoxylon argillaceum]